MSAKDSHFRVVAANDHIAAGKLFLAHMSDQIATGETIAATATFHMAIQSARAARHHHTRAVGARDQDPETAAAQPREGHRVKALFFLLRAAVLLAFIPIVWAVFFYDAAREHSKKQKLGAAYEGPAEE